MKITYHTPEIEGFYPECQKCKSKRLEIITWNKPNMMVRCLICGRLFELKIR